MSKVVKANSQHSIDRRPPNKNCPEDWLEYLDLKTNQMMPSTNSVIERTGLALYTWCKENKNALKMHEFCTFYGISKRTLHAWRDKNERFAHYYEESLQVLGDRRERGAIMKEYDASMIKPIMHVYDPDWKQSEEWRAKLANKIEDTGTKIVVIEKYNQESE